MNGKSKHFKVKLRIQVTKFEFPIQGPIWGIGSPLSPNFRDGECWWEEELPYLDIFHPDRDRDREAPHGDALTMCLDKGWFTLGGRYPWPKIDITLVEKISCLLSQSECAIKKKLPQICM